MVQRTVVEMNIRVGSPAVVESFPEGNRFAVVFEDDGDTGYFYGLDTSKGDQPIVDALLIYEVDQERPTGRSCQVSIRWSTDLHRAALYLDGRAEAAFDFEHRRAGCRSNFPPSDGTFSASHDWDESLIRGL